MVLVLLATCSILLLAIFSAARWRLGVAFAAPWAFLGLLEAGFAWQFGTTLDANALSLVAETNPAEAGDLIAGFGPALVAPILIVALSCTALARRPPFLPHSLLSKRSLTYVRNTRCHYRDPST